MALEGIYLNLKSLLLGNELRDTGLGNTDLTYRLTAALNSALASYCITFIHSTVIHWHLLSARP